MPALLFAAAALAAVVDWWALWRDRDRVEQLAKPAVLVLLIAAAVAIDPSSSSLRAWFVAGLVLSLVGDVALLPRINAFIVGLGAFLLAHVAYAIGMAGHADSWTLAVIALVLAVALAATVGRSIIAGAGATLRLPVAAYLIAVSAMLVAAYATGSWVLAAGALSFVFSDALLGYGRFVAPVRAGRLAIHVSYHAAQALLVIGLR